MKNDNSSFIKARVLNGIAILIGREFGMKGLSILGQIILLKIIAPQYFGLLAIILFIPSIAELFTDLGLTQAIIREKKELSNLQLSTIFYIKMILSLIAFIFIIICFPLVKLLFRQLNYANMLMIILLATTLFIKAARGVLVALLDKELDYRSISKVDLAGVIIYLIVAIVLALEKYYLWNFIWALFLKEVVELIFAWYYRRWIPLLRFDISSVKKLVKFGSFLQIGNFLSFMQSSIVPLVGYGLTSYSLGLLNWSLSISKLSDALFQNYARVAYAGMSKIQDNRDKLSISINKSTNLLNILSFLFIALIFGYSREFVQLLISPIWLPALPSLYWFVGGLLFLGGSITISHALLVVGKSKEVSIFTGINIFMEIMLAFFLIKYMGFSGIAMAVFISSATQFIGYYILAKRSQFNIEIRQTFFDKVLILILIFILTIILNSLFFNDNLSTFLIKNILTVVVYISLLYFYSKQDIYEILSIANIVKPKMFYN